MKHKEAIDLYGNLGKPTQFEGTWKVQMWGWWRFMRLDKKVIKGNRGYNVFLGIKWGHFTVKQLEYSLLLEYDNGKVTDYLKFYTDGIMIGRYFVNGLLKAHFALLKTGR